MGDTNQSLTGAKRASSRTRFSISNIDRPKLALAAQASKRTMHHLAWLAIVVALAGCATPPPPTGFPTSSPTTQPPASIVVTTCLGDARITPSGVQSDPCPSAVAATRAVVGALGLP